MTLTEIRLRLSELDLRPSRRFGQNFLHDQNIAKRIVESAGIQKGQNVIEIGPGLGALTQWIVENGGDLTVIEQDARLAGFLKNQFPQIEVIEADALEIVSNLKSQISNSIVLGNLPYSIASPLIVRLCESDLRPQKMIFTIQLEVAERLVAEPNCKDFGLLTLFTQAFYKIKMIRKIPTSVFWPQPSVESATVEMIRHDQMPFENEKSEQQFRSLVKQAFQKRRKTLGAIFGSDLHHTMDPQRRPEELSLQEWIAFASPHSKTESCDTAATDEIFDVVDENDQVIAQEKRKEVHRRNLLHRAVHIFIWNKKGKLLLQKRSSLKDVAPNTWDSSAAGHLGTGEEYDQAAEREIIEELGISPPLKALEKFDARKELGWEFVWLYEGVSEGPFEFPTTEISEVRWWSEKEIKTALKENPSAFAPSFRYIWKKRATA